MPLPRETQWDNALLETVVATAVNGVVALNGQGQISIFNSACERMFQYRREDVRGLGFAVLLAPPFREEYEQHFRQYRETGRTIAADTGRELVGQRRDGSTFPIFLTLSEDRHSGKRKFVAIIYDLSAVAMERAVFAQERAFLAAIVDSSNDGIISKTLDGRITTWNKAAERIFGYTAEEMIGTPITRLFPEDRLVEEAEIIDRVRTGEVVEHYETVRARKDGSLLDVSVTVSPIRDGTGTVIGASKTVRDITDRKEAEARLELLSSELNHVARVSEMGQVSAALAHELNQPLTAVLNYTNVAKRLLSMPGDAAISKAAQAVAKAGDQAMRASEIIRRLRDFVEKRETARTTENINAVLEDTLGLAMIGSSGSNITTSLDLTADLPLVIIDRVQIQQVLVNLLRNAAEAMAHSPLKRLTVSTGRTPDGGVQVAVADTGSGISASLAEKLFRPFVTTKPGGMGIGLAISRSIVESHGGRLIMSPNSGGGTVFQFTLPAPQRMTRPRDG